MSSDDWLSVSEAASVVGVTPAAVRKRLARHGDEMLASGDARRGTDRHGRVESCWELSSAAADRWGAERQQRVTGALVRGSVSWVEGDTVDMLDTENRMLRAAVEHAENERLNAEIARLREDLEQSRVQIAAFVELVAKLAGAATSSV